MKMNNLKKVMNLGLEIFKDKKFVDVKSRTIGKGFCRSYEKMEFWWVESFSWCFSFS